VLLTSANRPLSFLNTTAHNLRSSSCSSTHQSRRAQQSLASVMHPKGPKPKGALSHLVHPPSPDSSAAGDLTKVRAYAACKSCRVKKVKCLPGSSSTSAMLSDGTPGPCQQCSASGVECTYPPTRDRAAYSRQYVQNLEGRVQALEGMTARLGPLLDAFERGGLGAAALEGLANGSRHHQHPQRAIAAGGTEHGDQSMSADEEDEDEPKPVLNASRRYSSGGLSEVDDGGQMAQDERGNYRWIGSSNTLSLLESFTHNRSPHEPTPPTAVSGDPGHNPYFGHVAGSGVVKALPGVNEVSYPSPSRAAEYVDAFFKEIYPVLPVVCEEDFREEYKGLMERRAKGLPESPGGVSRRQSSARYEIVLTAVHLRGLRHFCPRRTSDDRFQGVAERKGQAGGGKSCPQFGDGTGGRGRSRGDLV